MNDSLEEQNDSNDTVLFSISVNEKFVSKQNFNETDVESIVNKYLLKHHPYEVCEDKEDNVIALSDEEADKSPRIKKLKKTRHIERKEVLSESSSSSVPEDSNELINDASFLQKLSEKYKINPDQEVVKDADELKPLSNKELKKIEKQQKNEERKRKKVEADREKCLKQVLATEHKNLKPGECMKFIFVYIDNDVVTEEYGDNVIKALQESDISYTITSQILPNTVSWVRKIQSHLIDDHGKLVSSSEDSDTEEILLIMKSKEFVDHVHNDSLISHIQSLKSVLPNKRFTLIIYGLQNYIKYQKSQKQKDFPTVSMKSIEYALTELQLLCNCSHRLLNSPSEVGLTVAQFSKAVAEIPYKLQKQEKHQQTDWFASGDNRDCVKVDKNGNGLQRLWKQMLTTFPWTSLETAEAITAMYPTMTSLMEAYEDKALLKPELVLQDIPIRRAAGPLSSMRRLGPELSKKVYNFFTSMDGDILL